MPSDLMTSRRARRGAAPLVAALLAAAGVLGGAALSGCGGSASTSTSTGIQDDAKATMQTFINDFESAKVDEAYSLLSPGAQQRHDKASFAASIAQSSGQYTITAFQQNGDTATATVEIALNGVKQTATFTLLRSGSRWAVDAPY